MFRPRNTVSQREFFEAIGCKRDQEIIDLYLRENSPNIQSLINEKPWGHTPLMLAIMYYQYDLALEFLKIDGIDVDIVGSYGITAGSVLLITYNAYQVVHDEYFNEKLYAQLSDAMTFTRARRCEFKLSSKKPHGYDDRNPEINPTPTISVKGMFSNTQQILKIPTDIEMTEETDKHFTI